MDPVDRNDEAIHEVRDEIADLAATIYESAERLMRILDTRMPELRKKGPPSGT